MGPNLNIRFGLSHVQMLVCEHGKTDKAKKSQYAARYRKNTTEQF